MSTERMPVATRKHHIRIPPETPCEHCGLPVGRRPVGDDPYFCCTGCEVVYNTLQQAGMGETYYRLRGIDGATSGPARVRTDDLMLAELDSEQFLAEHTREAGSDCRNAELFLDGVHCAACVWLVERLPYELEGVQEARLDLARARLSLKWAPDRTKLSDVATWLARFGYQAHPLKGRNASVRTQAERRLLIKAGVAWALAGNIMLLAFALYSGLGARPDDPLAVAARYLSLLLAIPAVFYAGSEFFARAVESVRLSARLRTIRTLHMDTPIAIGITVGFAHSVWATISGRGDVWFDSIAVLIAALLTARWMQLRSRRLAGDAGERLLSLIPTMVRRRMADGSTQMMPGDELQTGDVVEVPAGEVIPVDGTIMSGASAVNNAVITGETRLEAVAAGSEVAAGATNVRAPLLVTVRAAAAETRIGRLLSWVRDGERRRAPVVLLADRLAGYFVVTVLALAILTAGLWMLLAPAEAAMHVVALLVITCPCALGMATPLAMAVASGKAARAGIFIKTDEAVQALSEADCIVLDKTGTITEGRPSLTGIETFGDSGTTGRLPAPDASDREDALLALAARAEFNQVHPLAQSIVDEAEERGLVIGKPDAAATVEVVSGNGVVGTVDDFLVQVGRPEWIAEVATHDAGALLARARDAASRGQTPVAIAIDGRIAGLLAFGDRIRNDAMATVERLHADGKVVYLLSGDHPDVVADVAARVGIPLERARGGVSPEEKEGFVQELRRDHRSVVMVGDGVNDAAALQAAHVGVAVHGGSTVSLVAADVFMTREGVAPLVDLVGGAHHVMHVIRRNLGISLAYNILGASAAIAGIVTPLMAAVAMPISSLVVVASSIMQRSFALPPQRTTKAERPAPVQSPIRNEMVPA